MVFDASNKLYAVVGSPGDSQIITYLAKPLVGLSTGTSIRKLPYGRLPNATNDPKQTFHMLWVSAWVNVMIQEKTQPY
jgi:hypothetical protein